MCVKIAVYVLAWSLPQSNWMRRLSGKKTCCRTMAVRSGAERWNHSCCIAPAAACCSAAAEASGRLHQISGGTALACTDAGCSQVLDAAMEFQPCLSSAASTDRATQDCQSHVKAQARILKTSVLQGRSAAALFV